MRTFGILAVCAAVASAAPRAAFAASSSLAPRWRRGAAARALGAPRPSRRVGPLAMLSSSTPDAPSKPGSELSWDSHSYVDDAPDTLVRGVEGNESMRRKFELMCREAQDKICQAIAELDGGDGFQEDNWVRENGGGGRSRVLKDGKVFEKAGCNLSVV